MKDYGRPWFLYSFAPFAVVILPAAHRRDKACLVSTTTRIQGQRPCSVQRGATPYGGWQHTVETRNALSLQCVGWAAFFWGWGCSWGHGCGELLHECVRRAGGEFAGEHFAAGHQLVVVIEGEHLDGPPIFEVGDGREGLQALVARAGVHGAVVAPRRVENDGGDNHFLGHKGVFEILHQCLVVGHLAQYVAGEVGGKAHIGGRLPHMPSFTIGHFYVSFFADGQHNHQSAPGFGEQVGILERYVPHVAEEVVVGDFALANRVGQCGMVEADDVFLVGMAGQFIGYAGIAPQGIVLPGEDEDAVECLIAFQAATQQFPLVEHLVEASPRYLISCGCEF